MVIRYHGGTMIEHFTDGRPVVGIKNEIASPVGFDSEAEYRKPRSNQTVREQLFDFFQFLDFIGIGQAFFRRNLHGYACGSLPGKGGMDCHTVETKVDPQEDRFTVVFSGPHLPAVGIAGERSNGVVIGPAGGCEEQQCCNEKSFQMSPCRDLFNLVVSRSNIDCTDYGNADFENYSMFSSKMKTACRCFVL